MNILSAAKTALIQKFALLLLRSFARKARQILYMVHGTSVHGTSYMLHEQMHLP